MIKSTSLLATVTVTGGNFAEGTFWFASTVALSQFTLMDTIGISMSRQMQYIYHITAGNK